MPFLYARLRGPAAAMMFVEKDYKNNHETPAATHELQRPSASLVLQSSYSLFLTCVFGTTELHLCIQPAWRKLPPSLPLLLYRNHNAGISPAREKPFFCASFTVHQGSGAAACTGAGRGRD
jgi:hypothetical protein